MFEKTYTCDNWYFEGSCSGQGKDIKDKEYGKIHRYYRKECLTNGISPFTGLPCRHCLYSMNGKTWHWLLKRSQRTKHGKVVIK